MRDIAKHWLLVFTACLLATCLFAAGNWYWNKAEDSPTSQDSQLMWVWDGCRWRLAREED